MKILVQNLMNQLFLGKRGSENLGLAVFKEDKLVGELDALECLSYLNINNESKTFFISVPNPESYEDYLDLYLSPTCTNDIKIDISNGAPYIKIKCKYSARIYSMGTDSQYLNNDILTSISDSCNSYLESVFSDYLYKTSREFKSDINGFGKYALAKFWTTNDFTNYNWNKNYKNAVFDVKVDTDVESSILLTET